MEIQVVTLMWGRTLQQWQKLMARCGLEADTQWEQTVLVWDGEDLAAAGSRRGNLLKCIAVDPDHRGEDLAARVLGALRAEAFDRGLRHLFLYTKPENESMFRGLFFYTVARSGQALLMEDRRDGVREFLESLPRQTVSGTVGAAVMNCDPFTLGHQYLIRKAAGECDWMYIFVLSEDQGRFSARDRLEMVRRGTADLPNVTVVPTGPYLISAATFPTYFLKNRDQADTARCEMDIAVFLQHYVPHFGIQRRYVGTEPLSPLTNRYNEALMAALPGRGVEVRLIPRLENTRGPVSASEVRRRLDAGEDIRPWVPETTYQYIMEGVQTHA